MSADTYLTEVEKYTDGLKQTEFAIDGMKIMDPFTTAHTIKTLQQMRDKLWEQYRLVGKFIDGFGGAVNNPHIPVVIPDNVVDISTYTGTSGSDPTAAPTPLPKFMTPVATSPETVAKFHQDGN